MDIGIDFSLILYILAAVIVGVGAGYYLLKMDRVYAAAGIVIGFIGIFTYFGLRWFEGLRLKQFLQGPISRTASWPPQINYCPDFLSLKQVGTGTAAQFFCVDAVGVSSLPIFTPNSIPSLTPTQNALLLTKDNTAQQYAVDFLGGNLRGLTWEGVYDGTSASNIKPPYPPTA
jgi:hypothetical protein